MSWCDCTETEWCTCCAIDTEIQLSCLGRNLAIGGALYAAEAKGFRLGVVAMALNHGDRRIPGKFEL